MDSKTPDISVEPRRRRRRTAQTSSTLADVAKLAGVSSASVSRALNSESGVSAEMRRRIDHAIQTLGWVPNGAAKALASQRSRTVGVLLPTLGHVTMAQAIEELQHELSAHGYTLTIGCTEYHDESAMRQALKMVERGVECLVLVGLSQPPQMLPYLHDRHIPTVVTFTSPTPNDRLPEDVKIIGFDNRAAMHDVVKHLLQLGHRNFGCVTVTREQHNDRMVHRVDGVREALAREGIAIRPQHLLEMPKSSIQAGREALARIMDTENPPTAIIATNDFFALGALFEAKSRGIAVPGQLSIVGFDDFEIGSHLEPALTTVRVPAAAMGKAVGIYIVSLLDGATPVEPPSLTTELIIRQTSGPAPR